MALTTRAAVASTPAGSGLPSRARSTLTDGVPSMVIRVSRSGASGEHDVAGSARRPYVRDAQSLCHSITPSARETMVDVRYRRATIRVGSCNSLCVSNQTTYETIVSAQHQNMVGVHCADTFFARSADAPRRDAGGT